MQEDMLARAERVLSGEDEGSVGFVARFLDAVGALEIRGEEEEAQMSRSLTVLAQPPFCKSRSAPAVLRQQLLQLQGELQNRAAHVLALCWEATPPRASQHEEILSWIQEADINASSRARCAVSCGVAGLDILASVLEDASVVDVEDAEVLHAFLLQHLDRSEALDALQLLYERASWLGRRVLLHSLGGSEHASLLPILVSLGKVADPSTRRLLVQVLGRVGHVAAEPFLLSLLDEVEPQVRLDVVNVLGALGTRTSIERLLEFKEPEAQRAIASIEERYPRDEVSSGGLTLVEGGMRGALSVSGATEGDIALYERVEHRVAVNEDTTGTRAMAPLSSSNIAKHEEWYRLGAGPRNLPILFQAELYAPYILIILILVTTLFSIIVDAWPTISSSGSHAVTLLFGVMPALAFFLLFKGIVEGEYRDRLKTLREGTPTFAELVDQYSKWEVVDTGKGYHRVERHMYVFSYLDEKGERHEKELKFEQKKPKIEDEPLERMLYLDTGSVVLFDEIGSSLMIREDGTFALSRVRSFAISFLLCIPLGLYLYALIHLLLPV